MLATTALAAALFFDDFSHADLAAAQRAGWIVRSQAGHPGLSGARWGGVSLIADPAQAGNHLLRLRAQTDGTPAGTEQAQACHQRKYLRGTYAARVRFTDTPLQGADGDPVVQSFYVISPLRHDFDPEFSEVDFEFLPNGGWGSPTPRLYAISWQTVRIEPWQAHNASHQEFGLQAGWRELLIQVEAGRTRHYLDGRLIHEAGGRNVPVVPMAMQFNLWFSPGGLLPPSSAPRVYEQDIDWVFQAPGQLLSPAEVQARVKALRAGGQHFVDTVPAAEPPLGNDCNF